MHPENCSESSPTNSRELELAVFPKLFSDNPSRQRCRFLSPRWIAVLALCPSLSEALPNIISLYEHCYLHVIIVASEAQRGEAIHLRSHS